jgi:hypothetical protein
MSTHVLLPPAREKLSSHSMSSGALGKKTSAKESDVKHHDCEEFIENIFTPVG